MVLTILLSCWVSARPLPTVISAVSDPGVNMTWAENLVLFNECSCLEWSFCVQ